MNALISPDNATTIQQVDRQLGQWLREALREPVMTDADRWLCSVWNGTADWRLLEQLLADNEPAVVSIPVLIGCLRVHRQPHPDRRPAALLERINAVAYERATSRLGQGQVGMLTGGTASLHYLLRAGAHPNKPHPYADQLIRQALDQPLSAAPLATDLSVGDGYAGLTLTLIEAAKRWHGERIALSVTEIKAVVARHVRYLLEHQIPVDSQADTWSVFPHSVVDLEWNVTERLSWEAGDLGQLLLLYRAHQVLDQPDIARWADRLSGYVLQRRAMNRVRMDALGLIDGLAGLSLLYRRLYLLTGRDDFWHEGEYWLGQLLTDIQAGNRPADWSLLTGTLGISGAIRQWLGHDLGLDLLFL